MSEPEHQTHNSQDVISSDKTAASDKIQEASSWNRKFGEKVAETLSKEAFKSASNPEGPTEPFRFDFDSFHFMMKAKYLSTSSRWLKKELLKPHPDQMQKTLLPIAKPVIFRKFEHLYGPVLDTSKASNILLAFQSSLTKQVEMAIRKLGHLRAFSKVFGREEAIKKLSHITESDMKRLGFSRDLLSDHVSASDYDAMRWKANPFKHPWHLEWFLLSRFEKIPDASVVFLRQQKLDAKLKDKNTVGEGIVVDGFSPNFMTDLAPIEFFEESSEEDFTPMDFKTHGMWTMIQDFPLGICGKKFFQLVRRPSEDPVEVAEAFPDIFKIDRLPGRETVILFPAFVPEADATQVLRNIWTRIVPLVKTYNNRCLKTNELNTVYHAFFKIRLDAQDWGFLDWSDFVQWANSVFNPDGSKPSLRVAPLFMSFGTTAGEHPDATSVFIYVDP